jgi:hypothetical protein
MAGFTSNTKDPLILKVVVDKARWIKLTELEKQHEQQGEAKKKILEQVPKQSSSIQFGAGMSDTKDEDLFGGEEQHGEGKHTQVQRANEGSEERFRRVIREELHRYFSKPPSNFVDYIKNIKVKDVLQHVPYINQLIGKGSVDSDLSQPPAPTSDNVAMHNSATNDIGFISEQGRSKPFFKQSDFLKLIPSRYHSRAKRLLNYFEANSMSVSWNSDGNITLGNEFIPDSNIYVIFSELYKAKPDINQVGYVELASFLMNAGLGHLFRKTRFWFTNRSTKTKLPIQTGSGSHSLADPWYYIGD